MTLYLKCVVMRIKVLIPLGIFCLLTLSLSGCIGGQTKPLGLSGVTSSDGILYLGSMDGKIMAVNSSVPSRAEWTFAYAMPSTGICGSSSVPAIIYGIPAVADNMICIGIYGGKVLMVNSLARSQNLVFPQLKNGEWEYPRTGDVLKPIVGSPVLTNATVYVCSSDGRVYALDMSYGDEKWRSDPLDDKLWTTSVVDGDVIYVSTFDGHIYTLSTEDGSLLPWVFEAEVGFVSSPVLYKNTVFVGSFDHNLYAVKIGGDKPLWKFSGSNWFWAAPVVGDDVVYAGCLDGKLYAVNAETGGELWEFDTRAFVERDRIVSSPILVDDLIVVACDSGEIYTLDANNGKLVDKVSIDASIQGAICVQGGIVYVRAQDNCLYAVDISQGKIDWKFLLAIE